MMNAPCESHAQTDLYNVFRAVLEAGDLPSTIERLLARAAVLKSSYCRSIR